MFKLKKKIPEEKTRAANKGRNDRALTCPEKIQRSDVQLSEGLASLGIMGDKLRVPEAPRT